MSTLTKAEKEYLDNLVVDFESQLTSEGELRSSTKKPKVVKIIQEVNDHIHPPHEHPLPDHKHLHDHEEYSLKHHRHDDKAEAAHTHKEYSKNGHKHPSKAEVVHKHPEYENEDTSLIREQLDRNSILIKQKADEQHVRQHLMGNDQIPLATLKTRGLMSPNHVQLMDELKKKNIQWSGSAKGGTVSGSSSSVAGLEDRIGFSVAKSSTITVGLQNVERVVPWNATINGWYIKTTSGSPGDIEIDVLEDGVSLVGGGTKPNLSSQESNSSTSPDWSSLTLTEGAYLTFNVQAGVDINYVLLTLDITST